MRPNTVRCLRIVQPGWPFIGTVTIIRTITHMGTITDPMVGQDPRRDPEGNAHSAADVAIALARRGDIDGHHEHLVARSIRPVHQHLCEAHVITDIELEPGIFLGQFDKAFQRR